MSTAAAITTQTIWQTFRDELDGFIRRRVPNAADAEDLRQQVYLNIHRHLQRGDPPRHLRGWIYQVARNAITDHRRRQAARRETTGGGPDLAQPAPQTDAEASADEVTEALTRCLLQMIDRLPRPYGEALRWSELEGMTQQAAAARAGISTSGMKSRIQRGRTMLRDALRKCCEVEFDARHKPIHHRCRGACNCS